MVQFKESYVTLFQRKKTYSLPQITFLYIVLFNEGSCFLEAKLYLLSSPHEIAQLLQKGRFKCMLFLFGTPSEPWSCTKTSKFSPVFYLPMHNAYYFPPPAFMPSSVPSTELNAACWLSFWSNFAHLFTHWINQVMFSFGNANVQLSSAVTWNTVTILFSLW